MGDIEEVKPEKIQVMSRDAGLPGGSDSEESACNAGARGPIPGSGRQGATEDEMVGWHRRLNGHECEHALGDSEDRAGWRAVVHRVAESDTTE